MAHFKQKASDPSHGLPLPFRSREAASNLNQSPHLHHVQWPPINSGTELKSQRISDNDALFSSANKENVKSWLDSTSPTSVLNSIVTQQHVQSGGEFNPPTPSPICSPSPSSPIDSTRTSMEQPRHIPPSEIVRQIVIREKHLGAQTSGKKVELGSTSKRHGKDLAIEQPPDSPTGSSFSSSSEGGLLALLASKLLSYKENGRPFSRYARESSGPIDEKHVMEDRSRKPPVEEINTVQGHPQPEELFDSNSLYRTASEAVSEFSMGSANGRTLSMEFNAMLVAAGATGIRQPSTPEDEPQQQLLEIQEDPYGRVGSIGVDMNTRASVRVGDMRPAFSDDEASRLISALTVMREGQYSEDMDFNSTLSEMPQSSRSSISSGSRRGEMEEHDNMQIVPTTVVIPAEATEAGYPVTNVNRESSLASSSSGSNGDHSLAMVLATHVQENRAVSSPGESSQSSSSNSSTCIEKTVAPTMTILARQTLEQVRREKVLAQALAYQDAKCSKCNNRYRREESKITSWENQQRIKASIRMKKVEMKLEQERAKAIEKMQNEMALAHRRAEERKASAEAVRAAKTARVAQVADSIRRSGKMSSTNVGCFPF